jgi:O-antigen ligase
MCLALVAISRGRKKWIAALLSLGSILAVVVGLGRTQLVGAALVVVAFGVLVSLTGRQLSRTVGALLVIVVLAIPVGAVVASQLRSGTFKRYESLSTSSGTTSYKENAWSQIPEEVAASPLGFGLGNSGAFAGRLGTNQNLLEGHGLTSETQYNVLVKELGAPGLLLWPALSIFVSLLIFRRIRRIRDNELALCLAGALAGFIPLPIEASSGFISGSLGGGAYYWFAIGVVAYWLAGPSRAPAHEAVRGGEDVPAALA